MGRPGLIRGARRARTLAVTAGVGALCSGSRDGSGGQWAVTWQDSLDRCVMRPSAMHSARRALGSESSAEHYANRFKEATRHELAAKQDCQVTVR